MLFHLYAQWCGGWIVDRVRDLSEVNSRITTGAVVFKFMKLISDNKLFTGGKREH